jgi:NAD(P)-dependent dehydrogenase (short-subunit alcohol dehydrogenase family)
MVDDFRERVAIVTGAASGIGHEVATQLAARGATVVVADANEAGAEAAVARLRSHGGTASASGCDVASVGDVQRMVAETIQRFRRIDILVHSAGVGIERSFLDTTPEEWRRLIDVDLSGTFFCCQATAREMVDRRYGRIITLSSTAGVRGGTGRAAYGAAKGGVISLTKVMAVELAPFGITVNALAPGAVETELVARMHSPETRRVYTAGIPAGRYGTPAEIAATAVFLASETASYVTGHVLAVDGGFLAAGVMHRRTHASPGR